MNVLLEGALADSSHGPDQPNESILKVTNDLDHHRYIHTAAYRIQPIYVNRDEWHLLTLGWRQQIGAGERVVFDEDNGPE